MALLPIYRVSSDGGNIGTFYAKNEKSAIQQAVDSQNQTAASFRRSQPAIQFTGLKAVIVVDSKGNRV